jgi:hypothetical protein
MTYFTTQTYSVISAKAAALVVAGFITATMGGSKGS